MASSRCAHDAIAANKELLDAIGGTNLCNELDNFWVVVPSITADNKERILSSLRNGSEDAGNKVLGVVRLLEDLDELPQSRADMVSAELVIQNNSGGAWWGRPEQTTYVPGAWPAKGSVGTVLMDTIFFLFFLRNRDLNWRRWLGELGFI